MFYKVKVKLFLRNKEFGVFNINSGLKFMGRRLISEDIMKNKC